MDGQLPDLPGLLPGIPGLQPGIPGRRPEIRGRLPYGQAQLAGILAACLRDPDPDRRLRDCAAALTARLVADGWLNSAVRVRGSGAGAYLEVVHGHLAAVRVNSPDPWLQRRVERLLQPLVGRVLNLNRLQQDLILLRRSPGVAAVQAELNRLADDPAEALLTLTITPGSRPWKGEFELRNDGSPGNGEFRATGALLKGDLALRGDTLLLVAETSWSADPSLGQVIGSISYALPLAERLSLSGSWGYTRNNLPEFDSSLLQLTNDQVQGLGQLEWVISEGLRHRWSGFAGVSVNHDTYALAFRAVPDIRIPLTQRSTYLRLGINGNGLSGPLTWGGNAYLLQGLASDDVEPGAATALGGLAQAVWSLAPGWQLHGRLAGQVALGDLASSMFFSVGSDTGLRGLPGQLITGENGWLGTAELAWTVWQASGNTLQLVPFIGAGGVSTALPGRTFRDTVGSGGVLARWLAGQHWSLELGWAQQFATDDNTGIWNGWLLDSGVYGKLSFRF